MGEGEGEAARMGEGSDGQDGCDERLEYRFDGRTFIRRLDTAWDPAMRHGAPMGRHSRLPLSASHRQP